MIPELGHFALILALLLALVQGTLPFLGAARNAPNLMAVARPAAAGQFVFLAFAFGCLAYAFLTNDFSVRYVAANSNSELPLHYRFTAVWGGHEGSMLLWTFMLALWGLFVSGFSRHLPDDLVARVLGVMGAIAVGFLLFLLLTSNPFERLLPAPLEGRDLNPLLQDPGMVFHPPMLYMGYVGFSIAFAFALAALLAGRLDAAWARWSRPWTTAAWVFLTLGIALGSFWAYYELGWGGWWFWDPVENASFMPWLVGTALIHSLAVTEKRGAFKSWTVLLAIVAFSLSLLGTFLVRSGVLTSVHAFATDPRRGVFILGFLALVIGVSLFLFAWRAPKVGVGGRFALLSRETLLLANNVLLLVATGAVLLGTLYPLFIDALGLGKISVGPPYFDAVFLPLMVARGFPHGGGAHHPLEATPPSGPGDPPQMGFRPRRGDKPPPALGAGPLDAPHHARLSARLLGLRHGRRGGVAAFARQPQQAAARLLGDASRPSRGRGVHHRRDGGEGLRNRAGRENEGGGPHHRGRLHLRLPGAGRQDRAQLPGHPGAGGGSAGGQARGVSAAGKASLQRLPHAHDGGRHRRRPHPSPLRLHGRAAAGWRLGGAGLLQALRELDLGRLSPHGTGGARRPHRPALPHPP
jgi:ABC-type transport system involved in cytochrome c biogenesis permease subunit